MTVRFTGTHGSSRLDEASSCIIGIPFNGTTVYPDSPHNAPDAIRTIGSIHSVDNSYSVWQQRHCADDTVVCDVGNIQLGYSISADEMAEDVADKLPELMVTNPIIIGGDHSISYPSVQCAVDVHEDLEVVVIDAHHDCFNDFGDDESLNHGNWLYHSIRQFGLDGATILAARSGANSPDEELVELGVEMIGPRWSTNWAPSMDGGPIWLSVDMDGFDPSVAPGVLTREPGGLSAIEGLELIARILSTNRVVGCDLVEFWPMSDVGYITSSLAAAIIREFTIYFSNKEHNSWEK